MGWRGELLPEAMPNIKQHLRLAMSTAALSAGASLDENLVRGPRSGEDHDRDGIPSSAPDEFPQEQTGELRRALDVRPGKGDTEMLVGFFDIDHKKVTELEFNTPDQGGRPLLREHLNDPEVQKQVLVELRTSLPQL